MDITAPSHLDCFFVCYGPPLCSVSFGHVVFLYSSNLVDERMNDKKHVRAYVSTLD